jgi:DNA recombination protein RmuC
MREMLFSVGERPILVIEAAGFIAGLLVLILLALLISSWRAARERQIEAAAATERARELDEKVAETNRIQAEMTGRMQTMAEIFGTRQVDLVRHLGERLDHLQHRVGQGLEATREKTHENLAQLGERLAIIDQAQKTLADLTREVVSLKDVLANKQARGAFGQSRMEAIVSDGLPPSLYVFQPTLSSGKRPDCAILLPNDPRPIVVDAKFPLEGFSQFREARGEDALRVASARVRNDLSTHIRDIAEKYLIPGETQDIALMFVPSEALHADLVLHFEDVVQRAHRARVVIVSPSLLMMAIQVMQTLYRDHRMQQEARVIQTEVRRLLEDVARLQDRVGKLDTHFRQALEDVAGIRTSAEKVTKRGERIDALDFADEGQASLPGMGRPRMKAAE